VVVIAVLRESSGRDVVGGVRYGDNLRSERGSKLFNGIRWLRDRSVDGEVG